jgi:hypothetical protein
MSFSSFAATFGTHALTRPAVQVGFQAQWFLSTYDQIANDFACRQDHDTATKFRSVSSQWFRDPGQDGRRRHGDRESRAIARAVRGPMHEAAALTMSARPNGSAWPGG